MALVNSLFKAGIIDEQEALELNKKIGNSDSEPKEILEFLYLFFQGKALGHQDNMGSVWLKILPHEERGELIQNIPMYLNFIEILYQEGVISEFAYIKIKGLPLNSDKFGYFSALHLSIELMSFSRSFTIEKQLEFADSLGGKMPYGTDGILHESKKKKLVSDIKAGKLKTNLDFFKYSYGCKLIDLSVFQNKEQNLLKKVIKVLNELIYGAFSITEISTNKEDFTGDPEYHNKRITIIIDTGARRHQHFYTFSESEDQSDNNFNLLLENILSFVNQMLADFNCNYRFTGIINNLNELLFPAHQSQYAICRFKEEHDGILDFYSMRRKFLFNMPSPLFYRFPLSYMQIDYAFYHIKKCGLLSHLNEELLDSVMSNIYTSTYNHLGDLLAVFPDVLALVNRTVSAGQKPYLEFLLALNHISNGMLSFTEINDVIPDHFTLKTKSTFKVSFNCNSCYHEVECNLICGEFDDSIIYYVINEIIRKDYTNYQLIQLINSNHQCDIYLFVTNQQSEYLQLMKLRDTIDRF